jgi:hypothetical protein
MARSSVLRPRCGREKGYLVAFDEFIAGSANPDSRHYDAARGRRSAENALRSRRRRIVDPLRREFGIFPTSPQYPQHPKEQYARMTGR